MHGMVLMLTKESPRLTDFDRILEPFKDGDYDELGGWDYYLIGGRFYPRSGMWGTVGADPWTQKPGVDGAYAALVVPDLKDPTHVEARYQLDEDDVNILWQQHEDWHFVWLDVHQ